MNNQIYEQTYTKVVEPTYGAKRDQVQDNAFESEIGSHKYSVLSRTDMTQHECYSIYPVQRFHGKRENVFGNSHC